MGYWNYRVVVLKEPTTGSESRTIHEIYYSDTDAIDGWIAKPAAPLGRDEKNFEGILT